MWVFELPARMLFSITKSKPVLSAPLFHRADPFVPFGSEIAFRHHGSGSAKRGRVAETGNAARQTSLFMAAALQRYYEGIA